MGVSVSYKGSGGSRAFNLDGIPTGDAARALGLPKKKHFVPQTLADALKMPQPEDPIKAEKENKVKLNRLDMNPGTLEDKVLPGGGVVVSQRGVCLRGEEDSPLVTGTKLFGSVMGSKKYHTIEEIDPPGTPRHVGAQNADEDPAPNNEPANVGEPYKYQVTSRIVAERDPIAKLLKFYELDKDVSVSPMGRTTGVTKERRRMIVSLRDTSAARAEFLHPFEVWWSDDATSQYSQGGAWVIWLPDPAKLVMVGGSYQAQIDYITQAQELPTGWYTISYLTESATEVWLCVARDDVNHRVTVALQGQPSGQITDVTTWNILVARMSTDTQTGARSVTQFVDSAVALGDLQDGPSTITLDDTSLDWNTNVAAQIKDWDTGTPAASTTIAQDIHNGNTTAQNAVVSRTTGGALQYQKPGTLAQLTGSSVAGTGKRIITGISWNPNTHKLEISSANIDIANGIITSWVDQQTQEIETTAISSIIGS